MNNFQQPETSKNAAKNVQEVKSRLQYAIAAGYDDTHIDIEELESFSSQNKLNSLITILKQKDHIQSMSNYDFVTSREALGEKIQLHLFPRAAFHSQFLNQPFKRLLSDIKYACKLFLVYSVLILIIVGFTYDSHFMSHLTTKNIALVFALVILCVIPNIVHNLVSHYASYDVIINDIRYGLKLVFLTYVLFLFA